MSFYGDVLKHETDSLDRKEKDFAPWSFKLNAEPKSGLKLSHTHKEGGKPLSSSKIELPDMPIPGVEGLKSTYEFDREKFVRSGSMDIYKEDAIKCNVALKWTWKPADQKNIINWTKKLTFSDLGGFVAYVQSEVETQLEAMDKIDHKHSVNLKGDDWSFGVAYDQLVKGKKVGMKTSY